MKDKILTRSIETFPDGRMDARNASLLYGLVFKDSRNAALRRHRAEIHQTGQNLLLPEGS